MSGQRRYLTIIAGAAFGVGAIAVGLRAESAALPTAVSGTLEQYGFHARHGLHDGARKKHVPEATKIRSVPFFSSGFTADGTSYPYTMVGKAPEKGGTTVVSAPITPLKFNFSNGLSFDGRQVVANTVGSPVFEEARFSTGKTQYGDAIQRATFWNRMKKDRDYHVLLDEHPRVERTVEINVPDEAGFAFYFPPNDKNLALVDINYFYALLQQQVWPGMKKEEFPILLSYNVFLYDGDPNNCCILGFHDAFVSKTDKDGDRVDLQTYSWASWSDMGFFGAPIADVHALSHEVSEWMNDPFTNNTTPFWQGDGGYGCNNFLETGDPLVGAAFPVTLHGYTYYPQTVALLPWFAREAPSSAYQHAYSYPDTSVLTDLPLECTP